MSDDQIQPDQEPENPGRELSRPDTDKSENASASDGNRCDKQKRVFRKEDYLEKLDHLATCAVIGVVPTTRANATRGIIATILSHLPESQAGVAAISDDQVLELYRENP